MGTMKIWKILGYLLLIVVALRIAVLFAVLAENRAPVGMWLVLLAGIATWRDSTASYGSYHALVARPARTRGGTLKRRDRAPEGGSGEGLRRRAHPDSMPQKITDTWPFCISCRWNPRTDTKPPPPATPGIAHDSLCLRSTIDYFEGWSGIRAVGSRDLHNRRTRRRRAGRGIRDGGHRGNARVPTSARF